MEAQILVKQKEAKKKKPRTENNKWQNEKTQPGAEGEFGSRPERLSLHDASQERRRAAVRWFSMRVQGKQRN